jgi:hypothetical protein
MKGSINNPNAWLIIIPDKQNKPLRRYKELIPCIYQFKITIHYSS